MSNPGGKNADLNKVVTHADLEIAMLKMKNEKLQDENDAFKKKEKDQIYAQQKRQNHEQLGSVIGESVGSAVKEGIKAIGKTKEECVQIQQLQQMMGQIGMPAEQLPAQVPAAQALPAAQAALPMQALVPAHVPAPDPAP